MYSLVAGMRTSQGLRGPYCEAVLECELVEISELIARRGSCYVLLLKDQCFLDLVQRECTQRPQSCRQQLYSFLVKFEYICQSQMTASP